VAKKSLSALRANPGTRSKLSIDQLTPSQQRERRRLQFKKDEFDPAQAQRALTPYEQDKYAKYVANQEFDPALRELKQEKNTIPQQARNINTWWDKFGESLSTSLKSIEDGKTKAAAALAASQASDTAQVAKEKGELQAQQDKDRASFGVAPIMDPNIISGQAEQARKVSRDTTGMLMSQIGDATKTQLAGMGLDAERQRATQGMQVANRDRALNRLYSEKRQDKAVKKFTNRKEIRQAEFENQLNRDTLGLNESSTAAELAAKANEQMMEKADKDRNYKLNEAKFLTGAELERERNDIARERVSKQGSKKKGDKLKDVSAGTLSKLSSALSLMSEIEKKGVKKNVAFDQAFNLAGTGLEVGGDPANYVAGTPVKPISGLPKNLKNVLRDIYINGYISKTNVNALHDAGLSVKSIEKALLPGVDSGALRKKNKTKKKKTSVVENLGSLLGGLAK